MQTWERGTRGGDLVGVVPVEQLKDGLRLLAVGGVGGALTQRQQLHLDAAELGQGHPTHLDAARLPRLPLVDVDNVVGDACQQSAGHATGPVASPKFNLLGQGWSIALV